MWLPVPLGRQPSPLFPPDRPTLGPRRPTHQPPPRASRGAGLGQPPGPSIPKDAVVPTCLSLPPNNSNPTNPSQEIPPQPHSAQQPPPRPPHPHHPPVQSKAASSAAHRASSLPKTPEAAAMTPPATTMTTSPPSCLSITTHNTTTTTTTITTRPAALPKGAAKIWAPRCAEPITICVILRPGGEAPHRRRRTSRWDRGVRFSVVAQEDRRWLVAVGRGRG